MNVSFDIDDTLVCAAGTPTEPFVPFPWRLRYSEPVRRGTKGLMQALTRRGCNLWVYTSSRRSEQYLHGWFRHAGVRLAGAVNLCRHEREVGCRGPSKFPTAFGIDLHIDDSVGVAFEGFVHGFQVVHLNPDDERWTERVLETVDRLLAHRTQPPVRAAWSLPRFGVTRLQP